MYLNILSCFACVDAELKKYTRIPGVPLYLRISVLPFGSSGIGEQVFPIEVGEEGHLQSPSQPPADIPDGLPYDQKQVTLEMDLAHYTSAAPKGFSLLAAVSLNGQDFSSPCAESAVCLSCTPTHVAPNCISCISSGVIVAVAGHGFFPPGSAAHTVVALACAAHSTEVLRVSATVDASDEVRFVMPTLDELALVFGQAIRATPSFELSVTVLINEVHIGAHAPFLITVYKPAPLVISSRLYRRDGSSTVSILSECLSFATSTSKVLLQSPDGGYTATLPARLTLIDEHPSMNAFSADAGDDRGVVKAQKTQALSYEISAALPPIPEAAVSGGHILLSLLLDGVTPPPHEHIVSMTLFDSISNIVCKNLPKGGYAPLTTVVCSVSGLVAAEECLVRIVGAEDNMDGPATIDYNESTVTFVIPEEITGIKAAETKGKAKHYYVGISIDGGASFDRSETAVLALK